MRTATLSYLLKRFGGDAKCRYWLPQKKGVAGTSVLKRIPWFVNRVTVLFKEPKCYLIDGDACDRDGLAFVVKKVSKCPARNAKKRD